MICSFSVKNFKAYGDKVDLSFFADQNIKRFDCNSIPAEGKRILKAVGFYGPNNTGKTCILYALCCLRRIMLNEPCENMINTFADMGDVTSFEVEYYVNGRFYDYAVDYDNRNKTYVRESLFQKTYNGTSSSKERVFERDVESLKLGVKPTGMKSAVVGSFFSMSLPFMVLVSGEGIEGLDQAKKDYLAFAQSLVFLKMDGPLDIAKTIQLLQNDPKGAHFVKEFVKNCDLHIDDFGYADNVVSDTDIMDNLQAAMNNPSFVKESLKLYSKHGDYRVPSVFFDSVGTMKLVALAGYIYESLSKGSVLMIDEIDSSLHHILTRSIVAMFNNLLNVKSQLLFTTQDVLLLDLQKLLRKDQVWLVDLAKEAHSSTLDRVSDKFPSRSENGIRGDEDIREYYLKGRYGAIPTPDLFASLEEAVSDE